MAHEFLISLYAVILLAWAYLMQRTYREPTKLSSATPTRAILGCARWQRLKSLTGGKEVLQGVYQKQIHNNQPYRLHGIFGDSIILPPSSLEWLISQPESRLSAKWAQMDALNIPTTFLRADIGLNPVHEPLVRRTLTCHLDLVARQVSEEVRLALQALWGTHTDEWRQVNLDYTIRRIIARAANRVFVGHELCHNTDYIEHSISYVSRVSSCGLLMNMFPTWLKRPIGAVLTIPIRLAYRHCSNHLLPVFSFLVSNAGSSANETVPTLGLFSSWLVSNSVSNFPPQSAERTPDFLSRRLMALNFATIHTSTMTTCNLLLDIFSRPRVVSSLRGEALRLTAGTNTTSGEGSWDITARPNRMIHLDSALRESMRLWGLVPKAMSRKVMHPSGIVLPGGQRLPNGATVCVSGWGLHHDQRLYPDPFEFVYDRFVRASTDGDGKPKTEKEITDGGSGAAVGVTSAAVEADYRFATWGIGKHACPGRFFAVDLVKIITTHVLLDYEVEALKERPENVWIEYNSIPPPSATLRIKRRR